MRGTAVFNGVSYTNVGWQDFTITNTNPCATASISMGNLIVPSMSIDYTAGDSAMSIDFDASYITSDYSGTSSCPSPFKVFEMKGQKDSSGFVLHDSWGFPLNLDILLQTLEIDTVDIADAGTYDIRITSHYKHHQYISQSEIDDPSKYFQFTVNI